MQIFGVLERCNTGNLCRNRYAPRLTALVHPLQKRRICTQTITQPQPCHRIVLGEGAQNHQVREGIDPQLHAVFFRIVQKIAEAFIHHQHGAAGSTADKDALQQLAVDQLSGRIVRVAQKDQIGLRTDTGQKLLSERKVLFLLHHKLLHMAAAGIQRQLIFCKGRNCHQRIFGADCPHDPKNQVGSTVAAQDIFLVHLLIFCNLFHQFPAKRVRITAEGIHRVTQRAPDRVRQTKRIEVCRKIDDFPLNSLSCGVNIPAMNQFYHVKALPFTAKIWLY